MAKICLIAKVDLYVQWPSKTINSDIKFGLVYQLNEILKMTLIREVANNINFLDVIWKNVFYMPWTNTAIQA